MSRKSVVVSPPFRFGEDGGLSIQATVPPDDLMKCVMYFDEIDYPDNNFISVDMCQDMCFLQSIGFLKRTEINFTFSGTIILDSTIPIQAQMAAHQENDKNEPGVWSLAQLAGAPYFPGSASTQGIDVELYHCLPIPKEGTPIHDILEFKERERENLIELRGYIDDIYLDILKNPEHKIALKIYKDKLYKLVDDVSKKNEFPRCHA